MKKKNYLTIKDFPPEIRPRERLFGCGPESLSDAELLAVVISTGREGETAIQLSQRILSEFGVLGTLGRATLEELSLIEGIGEAKAARILASLELGRRLSTPISTRRPVISTPRDAADLLMSEMRYFDKEHFKALILDTKNEVLKVVDISIGSLDSAVVHPRELFKIAIKHSGAAVIVVHNHPSGDATPSSEDIALTKRLARAGEVLGIDFLDHIVVGDGEFTSLKERGFF